MNHTRYYQILVILLFIILSVGFCFGEVVIRVFNDKTGKFEDFVMTPELRAKYDRQGAAMRRQMMETGERSDTPPTTAFQPDSSQPQSPGSGVKFLTPIPAGAIDQTGKLYPNSDAYFDPKTGRVIPK